MSNKIDLYASRIKIDASRRIKGEKVCDASEMKKSVMLDG